MLSLRAVQLVNPVLLFQSGAGQCSREVHGLFLTNEQMLKALSEASAWC